MRSIVVGILLLGGCSGGGVDDPAAVLANARQPLDRHRVALTILETTAPTDTTIRMLKHMLGSDEYSLDARALAYERLRLLDLEALQEMLELRLPRVTRTDWREWLCEAIARDQWIDMTPTLIRAWARPVVGWTMDPSERPERLALVSIFGEDRIADVLLQVMLDANPVTAANLRARCWELLVEEGSDETLRELLRGTEAAANDGMVLDLQTVERATGLIPHNREEILWARALCTEEHKAYLKELSEAIDALPIDRRATLELRDLAVVHATFRHEPELLSMDVDDLIDRVQSVVRSEDRRIPSPRFEGWVGNYTEALHKVAEELDWADALALLLATKAMATDAVALHIFDQADRDLTDSTTELGGVMALDREGRFVLIECEPRTRQGDNQYLPPQEAFDQGYVGLFHYHNHAQKYQNREYAGPHLGDFAYANNTRANCLVFTFLSSRELNVDFYRHGKVVVDLGVIKR